MLEPEVVNGRTINYVKDVSPALIHYWLLFQFIHALRAIVLVKAFQTRNLT
jgi:hypothetical protein